jgi:hypothetical protein
MIFLAAVGAAVELGTGSTRFASVYLISGVVGVLCHFLATRHSSDPAPVIGASGCIAGCAAYYSVRYKGLRVAVGPNLSLSVAAITVVWVVLQLVGAVVHLGDAQTPVSFWSHLGGFGAGLILCVLYKAPDIGQLKMGHEVLATMNLRGPAATVAAVKKHLKTHPDDVIALRQIARAYAQMGETEHEAAVILRLVDLEEFDEQAALMGRLVEINMTRCYTSGKLTALAEKFKERHQELSKALLHCVLQYDGEDPYRPEAMLALAALERGSEPDRANKILRNLIADYPLHPCAELARKRGWVR